MFLSSALYICRCLYLYLCLYLSSRSQKQHWQHLPRPQILSSVLEEGSWLPIERGRFPFKKILLRNSSN